MHTRFHVKLQDLKAIDEHCEQVNSTKLQTCKYEPLKIIQTQSYKYF